MVLLPLIGEYIYVLKFIIMKKSILLLFQAFFILSILFVSCETEEQDECSSELGDIGDRYNCDAPVMPQICTVDGVDDHWILDDEEYSCNGDCSVIPQDMIDAILEKEGCGTKKSLDLVKINAELSERAKVILADLKMESVLCNN